MQSEKVLQNRRRSFFKKLALIGGALALSPLAWKRSPPSGPPDAPRTPQAGYRLTPHIRKYYETAAK
ncbi:MAG: hypothetical protein VR64_06295 [Desulfatitalea sp. BRH_c12]|nr:MAG: hypothetical protein VR64_06295 [Desulfatitalea sp. BRH_c12]